MGYTKSRKSLKSNSQQRNKIYNSSRTDQLLINGQKQKSLRKNKFSIKVSDFKEL